MITAILVLGFTAFLNIVLGVVVFATQPRRPQNRFFAIFSTIISLWAFCMMMILSSTTPERAEWFIRLASYQAVLLPLGFYWLCLAIAGDLPNFRAIWTRTRNMTLLSQAAGLLCFSPWYLEVVKVHPSTAGGWAPPQASYGPAFAPYNVYFLLAFGWIVARFIRNIRGSQGLQRTELQFVVLGMVSTLVLTLTTNVIYPALTGKSHLQPFGPLGFLTMNMAMAYGIATKRVLEMAVILRRIAAYGLLLLYLGLLYGFCIVASSRLMTLLGQSPGILPQLLGATVVAISVAPAQGLLQRLANRLFITAAPVDVKGIVNRATRAMQSITTLDELLATFSDLVGKTVNCESVTILLPQDGHYEQEHPDPGDKPPVRLPRTDPIVTTLKTGEQPLVADVMRRRRLSPEEGAAAEAMSRQHVAVAVGIRLKNTLSGIMLLGPRVSGRVYAAQEEEALQILANELGVAVENATLYTETRNSHIYTNTLLDSLVSGVIAVNSDKRITVFNSEARRVLRVGETPLLNTPVEEVPEPLRSLLTRVLDTGTRLAEEELIIEFDDENDHTHVRAAGAMFHAHTGETLGALIVFHDITQLKALELQIRRQDRLASMGTLSAGMAHEIKNPLVTIKTFTQLLPDRFDDAAFRTDFTSLVGNEVRRIDGIVNQLLTFARPSKPQMRPIHMHEVISEALRLVDRQMDHSRVKVSSHFEAEDDLILGDATLLNQALINFFLNAKEAMGEGGSLEITTAQLTTDPVKRSALQGQDGAPDAPQGAILISIADAGPGIAEEDLLRVFDPFFTTKSTGTGLGLAVAHGIIQEQGGIIDVESRTGVGTVFKITFPLHVHEEAVT